MKYIKLVIFFTLIEFLLSGNVYSIEKDHPDWVDPVTGMEFAWIPDGCISIGSDNGFSFEKPVHKVCVKGFYFGKYSVTQAQYMKITGDDPSNNHGYEFPVENISWFDAFSAATILGTKDAGKFRLPTEAEWEYACRAGDVSAEFCGSGNIDDSAWTSANSAGQTHKVGEKKKNNWGLYDMTGNVLEWVQDCWHENYIGAPEDGGEWDKGNCQFHILRGGSIINRPKDVRASIRFPVIGNSRTPVSGFRLVRKLD